MQPLPPKTREAAGATTWSAVEISCRYGAQFVVMLILARLLQPSDFGQIAMLVVFTSVATLLVDGGFSASLVQNQRASADDETTVFLFSTSAALVACAALWAGAPAIAGFYQEPSISPLLRFVSVTLPLAAIGSVPDAVLTRRLDFKSRTRAEIVATLASAFVAITAAWRGFGVWSLAWHAMTSTALRSLMLWRYSRWRPTGVFSAASFRRLFGFGGYLLLAGLLDTLALRLQSLLIGKLFDARALGYYALAQNTQQAPTSFVGSVLNRVGLPVFSSVAHQPEKLVGALRLSLRAALFVFVPCMVGIAVTAGPLIDLLYGKRWSGAAPILSLLALSAALWPLHVLNLAALNAQGRSHLYFRLEVVKKIVGVGLILACSPGGPLMIAAAVLATSLFGTFVNTWYTKRLLGYGLLAQLSDQRSTLLLSCAAALVGWAILHWNRPSLPATAAAILLAGIVYFVGARLSANPGLAELIALARGLRSPAQPPPPAETAP
jgi:O-antigen/teichoic acid export membrane protein